MNLAKPRIARAFFSRIIERENRICLGLLPPQNNLVRGKAPPKKILEK